MSAASEEGGMDICGDGTVMKWVLKEGSASSERPKAGDRVSVHYVGRLTASGEEFDSSRSRGRPFEFRLGSGVIEGWSIGVATMAAGEVAKLRIASSKGYGARGSPPKIPGEASLDFEIELLSFTDREEVNPEGPSVLKKVLVSMPDKWRKPNGTCDVEFKYRAVGEAAWVEATWTRTEAPAGLPAELRAGLESMVEGETASFSAAGREFEVEMSAWIENEECVPADKGGVVKRVERPFREDADVDWKTPGDTSEIRVRGSVRLASSGAPVVDFGPVSDSHAAGAADESGTTWCVDEHDGYAGDGLALCDGVEAALKRMKIGEIANVRVAPKYGFGDAARVPPEAVGVALEARLELCAIIEEKPAWELALDDKIAVVDHKRALGNRHFGNGDYARASRRYTQAIDIGASDYDMQDDDRKKRLKLATDTARLNRAACRLKTGDFTQAKADADAVLADDPDNAKALFRRAKALTALDDWPQARADLKTLLRLDPASADAKRALADLAKREKAYKNHQRKLYAGRDLFGKISAAKHNDKPDATAPTLDPDQAPPPPQQHDHIPPPPDDAAAAA